MDTFPRIGVWFVPVIIGEKWTRVWLLHRAWTGTIPCPAIRWYLANIAQLAGVADASLPFIDY